MPDTAVTVFGIRHHGPGCARSLRAALAALQPDIVLVEGPPDAQQALPLLGDPEMVPPVALLVYAPENPRLAAFYPFTVFSPEWQALGYAAEQGIPARFMDLPQAVALANPSPPNPLSLKGRGGDAGAGDQQQAAHQPAAPDSPHTANTPNDAHVLPSADLSHSKSKPGSEHVLPSPTANTPNDAHVLPAPTTNTIEDEHMLPAPTTNTTDDEHVLPAPDLPRPTNKPGSEHAPPSPTANTTDEDQRLPSPAAGRGAGGEGDLRDDPIGALAIAAGYQDRELWWEHQIEQRQDATGLFEGILEAMTALRDAANAPLEHGEAQREAHMRQIIRAARKEGFARIAVVCGAWHAPVLAGDLGPARADADLLANLPRLKVTATWIPWTNSRLSYRSGYGAGINSPGWYEHLWQAPDRVAVRWLTHVAVLLRAQDLDASSASVIEAVRLADALAALRDLPMPGLAELNEATLTVLCGGDPAPMALICRQLEIGERLGEVPESTPTVPLAQDLATQQRRLKLKPSTEIKTLDLDLRSENDRARSHLLHRLSLLDIPWGTPQQVSGKAGSFHEVWQIQWQVEFAVKLIEANVWGNTVEVAAGAYVCHTAEKATALPGLTELLDAAILAELPAAVDHLLTCINVRAAIAADVRLLMDALPPLARVARYGNVRQTRTERILPVIEALFERVLVGLPAACAALNDEAAEAMAGSIGHVQESVDLLDRPEQREEWQAILRHLIHRDDLHGLLRGWACRLLLERKALDEAELQRLARLALSPVNPAEQAAAWISGVLRGSGLLLLHQDGLWAALDAWLRELDPDSFVTTLPLLRRAFSGFQPPERRSMGEKVRHLSTAGPEHPGKGTAASDLAINRERADLVLPILAHILGTTPPPVSPPEHLTDRAAPSLTSPLATEQHDDRPASRLPAPLEGKRLGVRATRSTP